MLEDMEELFDLNVVSSQQTAGTSGGSAGTGGMSSSTSGTVSSSSSGEVTNVTGSSGSVVILTSLWKCCNLRDCYSNTCYYCLCCCPAISTRGLMGFRTVRHSAPGLAPSAGSSNANTNSNVIGTSLTNTSRNADSTAIVDAGLSGGGHFLSINLNTQDEELYNPETLHKYSSEMRDSNFLFFTNENEYDDIDSTAVARSNGGGDFRSSNAFVLLPEGFGGGEAEPLMHSRWSTNGGSTSPMRHISSAAASLISGSAVPAAATSAGGYGSNQARGRSVYRHRPSLSPVSLIPDV